jgi:catechol 2,3-dioxygenase-like lactoylglutathione lyase family enzyme
MNYQLDYIRLLVSNFKDCFLFYRDVLGFKATYGSENDVYADFDTGKTTLALFSRSNMSETVGTLGLPENAIAQDKTCLVFGIENVNTACQRLISLGVSLLTEPADRPAWGIRTAHFRDPDGNLIEIFQPLPPPAQSS